MGLERRGNNNYYYYRKERTGSRVASVYEGKGSFARLMAQFEDLQKAEEMVNKESVQKLNEAEGAQQEEIGNKIDTVCVQASALVDALFLTNGYHKHSRTWRRKRND